MSDSSIGAKHVKPNTSSGYTGRTAGELSSTSKLLSELKHLSIRNAHTLKDMFLEGIEGGFIDDKTYIMERVIQLAAELPLDSTAGVSLTNSFLTKLWSSLSHPPLSNLGSNFQYRSADGSHNSLLFPQLGAAGSPYARTVRPATMTPITLPDPNLVFDSVMARRTFKPHPSKISSMLFYLASIIIHDLFRTDRVHPTCTRTSSYLDLAPLYGSNQEEQDLIRTFNDGKLKPDAFSEKRLLSFPPGVGVLLIMFNRFHNYVVEQLALINENGRFARPVASSGQDRHARYDNDLFQTGRLVTCGLYVNIILKDYVRTILNLNRTHSLWTLDPRSENGRSTFNEGAPEGVGNQVSAEFNLIYRWHSCISQRDEKWSENLFGKLLPDKDAFEVNVDEFILSMGEWEMSLPVDPADRPFANLQRAAGGSFNDEDLAAIFADGVEDCAGAFGAKQVPVVLRAAELLGIKQARSWNLATLNEFRQHFKLGPHKTFEDINSDPQVAESLRRLYEHPDFVELYPGVILEETKEVVKPGSGLCTNFTTSRAILSDAVSLVRGDRFYTIDFTPKHLTNWGFSLVKYDLNIDFGCSFYKLVLCALPRHFRQDSVYAHYPLVIPSENRHILTELGFAGTYTFDRAVSMPTVPIPISSWAACKSILENTRDFQIVWGDAIKFLLRDASTGEDHGSGYMLSGDCPEHAYSRSLMKSALHPENWEQEVASFYRQTTLQLLHRNAHMVRGYNQVDIIRDVSNPVQAHFASNVWSLPLKTEVNPKGLFSEQELYNILGVIFASVFYDADPMQSFPLRQKSRSLTQRLGKIMELNVRSVQQTGFVQNLLSVFYRQSPLAHYGVHMIRHLLASGKPVKELVWTHMLATVSAMVANQSQLFSQCLDFYLSDEGKIHLPEINRLSKEDSAAADEALLHYFMEGSRLRSVVGLFRETTRAMKIQDSEARFSVEAGQRIACNLVAASMDPSIFPNPSEVVLDRGLDLYVHYGSGPHRCLGYGLSKIALTTMLKTIGRLDNLRRAPGPQGEIKKVPAPLGFTKYMAADQSTFSPFPTTMKIQWDGELPPMAK